VEVRGEKLESIKVSSFLPPRSLDVGWGIPPFLHGVLRGALTTRPEIEAARCVLCHICSQTCPTEAIREQDGRLVIDQMECIRCFCCQELCPEGAVRTKQGWAARHLGIRQG
jgi:Pyruvate/2-oxoacid:ferredoxin oxidoreductase delta subunit